MIIHQHAAAVYISLKGFFRFSGMMDAPVEKGFTFDDRNFLWFSTESKRSFFEARPPPSSSRGKMTDTAIYDTKQDLSPSGLRSFRYFP